MYQYTILEKVVMPLFNAMVQNLEWSFQQDSLPGHQARTTHASLETNVLLTELKIGRHRKTLDYNS